MNLYIEKYKNINIVSKKKKDIRLLVRALDILYNLDKDLFLKTKCVKYIFFGEYKEGGAIAATFVDKKAIVLTPQNWMSLSMLITIIAHEITHMYHFKTNPKEYKNQYKAEKIAFDAEMNISKKIGAYFFEKEVKKVSSKFLNFLKKEKTTANKKVDILKNENILMEDHKKILDKYLKFIKDDNKKYKK